MPNKLALPAGATKIHSQASPVRTNGLITSIPTHHKNIAMEPLDATRYDATPLNLARKGIERT